ncbi:NDR1/HIN1-like protein 6 [Vicia villosa]|uniref:NDR1/HIN1-like protein 6 n=1 Tax=Vicia villosa TaxID=3911 RepID=UPI00273C559B|nr:NDR1/HIN1-like protein 6 [Vicia villosa]
MPTYNVENLDVNNFDLQKSNNLHTDINVVMKAVNPNADIGLDYLQNEVSISYSGTKISVGKFQPFLQKGKETTIFNVTLKGDSDFDPILQNKLLLDQNLGHIPLLIMVKVPVRIVIDDLIHLRKFVVDVNCSLVIDQLKQNKKPNILKKDFTYDIHM